MAEYLKIPKERVPILIGQEGKTKRGIENKCKVDLIISSDGGVNIEAKDEGGLSEWRAKEIIHAIGRGFNPKYAMLLSREEYGFELINLYDILKRKDSEVRRVKSRIIGEQGKARKTIETLTDTKMSIYGRTVGIIGYDSNIELAKKAIEMILNGAKHPSVYKFLEENQALRSKGL